MDITTDIQTVKSEQALLKMSFDDISKMADARQIQIDSLHMYVLTLFKNIENIKNNKPKNNKN